MIDKLKNLTILSVSFKQYQLIEENIRLTKLLNPIDNYRWIVVNNTPNDDPPKSILDLGFKNLKGPDPNHSRFKGKGGGSYHHAEGLQIGLKEVKTRFVLVLDPDYFLLEQDWINMITEHMISRKLSFFGAVWNPFDFMKQRNFPSVHCLFIDLQRVSIEEIDFTPELDRTNALKSLMRRIRLPRPIMNLALISVSRDTGYKILRKFKNNPAHQFELFSFLSTDSNKYSRWYEYSNSYIKKFVPERFSIFPKSRNYVVSNNYLQMDFSLLRNGWECFCWKGKLVGLHFRSVGNKRVAPENEIAALREFLRLSKILK